MMRHGIGSWRAGFAGLGIALALACGEEASPPPPAPVTIVAPVESHRLVEQIASTGELLAVNRAEIAAEVAGRITELLMLEGDAVEAGQVVMRIDPQRRELEVSSAQAGLAEGRSSRREAQRDFDRVKRMREGGAASAAQFDGAAARLEGTESRLSAAQAALGVAERALADAEVRAPYSGVIARRRVSRGEYVTPGHSLFELVSVDPLEVEFHLAERDSSRVAVGRDVTVRVASHPEETFLGTVHMVSPTIEARTRTLRVKATVDNSARELRPGLFARVELGVRVREGVLMVPEEAVMQRASGPEVFVLVEDERAERRKVRTGTHHDGRVEVVEGLRESDWVITQGNVGIADGSKVRPQLTNGSPWPGSLARRDTEAAPHP